MSGPFLFDPDDVAVPVGEPVDAGGRPLHVEVGFGKDVRVLRAAEADPGALFLGVEVSRKKAASFRRKVARAGLRNVLACHGDVREVLRSMLAPMSVHSFTILFPDPWPKRRHWKHRWIQPEAAALLERALVPGGRITVATDHEGYREQIRGLFLEAGLELERESSAVPDEDRTLFAERFARLGADVTYQRWRRRA